MSRLSRIERARLLAWRSYMDGHSFHEIAIRSVFEAEIEYQKLCKSILEILGPPKTIRFLTIGFESQTPDSASLSHKAHTGFEPVFTEDADA